MYFNILVSRRVVRMFPFAWEMCWLRGPILLHIPPFCFLPPAFYCMMAPTETPTATPTSTPTSVRTLAVSRGSESPTADHGSK